MSTLKIIIAKKKSTILLHVCSQNVCLVSFNEIYHVNETLVICPMSIFNTLSNYKRAWSVNLNQIKWWKDANLSV